MSGTIPRRGRFIGKMDWIGMPFPNIQSATAATTRSLTAFCRPCRQPTRMASRSVCLSILNPRCCRNGQFPEPQCSLIRRLASCRPVTGFSWHSVDTIRTDWTITGPTSVSRELFLASNRCASCKIPRIFLSARGPDGQLRGNQSNDYGRSGVPGDPTRPGGNPPGAQPGLPRQPCQC